MEVSCGWFESGVKGMWMSVWDVWATLVFYILHRDKKKKKKENVLLQGYEITGSKTCCRNGEKVT